MYRCSFIKSKYHLTKYFFKFFSNRKAPHEMSSYFQRRKCGFTYGQVVQDHSGRVFLGEIIQVDCSSGEIIQVEIIQVEFTLGEKIKGGFVLGENIKGGFVLGENIKGGFSYQSARARKFRARFPLSQFGREHSGRVFLLVRPGEIIQVEFSFLSDRSRTFRASVPWAETFRASLKRAKLPSTIPGLYNFWFILLQTGGTSTHKPVNRNSVMSVNAGI